MKINIGKLVSVIAQVALAVPTVVAAAKPVFAAIKKPPVSSTTT